MGIKLDQMAELVRKEGRSRPMVPVIGDEPMEEIRGLKGHLLITRRGILAVFIKFSLQGKEISV